MERKIFLILLFAVSALHSRCQVEFPNEDVKRRFCTQMGESYEHYSEDGNKYFLYDLLPLGGMDSCHPLGIEIKYSNSEYIRQTLEEKKQIAKFSFTTVTLKADTLTYHFTECSNPRLSLKQFSIQQLEGYFYYVYVYRDGNWYFLKEYLK